jgi:hypothetical protein
MIVKAQRPYRKKTLQRFMEPSHLSVEEQAMPE